MAPKIIPFKINSKKKANKKVSFGDVTEKKIEIIPQEESAAVWYNTQELASFRNSGCDSKIMACSKETWIHARKHALKIKVKCSILLEHSDGHWNPKMTKELGKFSVSHSKGRGDAAVQRAMNVYKEVYHMESEVYNVPQEKKNINTRNKVLPNSPKSSWGALQGTSPPRVKTNRFRAVLRTLGAHE